MKNDKSARIDKFEVARRLDGLQEKFQVLNNDELSDALRLRLEELDTRRFHWSPEALFLFLELSNNPASLSKVENIEILKPADPTAKLTWDDLDVSDTFSEQEDIWKDIDYKAESSDDDEVLSITSSDVSIPRITPQSSKVPLEEFVPPDNLFITVEDEDLVESLQKCRFETDDIGDSNDAKFLSELQVIRDTIFMLEGLPAAVFQKHGSCITADRRICLRHTSRTVFHSLLESFCRIGSSVWTLRVYVKTPQTVPFMQTFQREVEILISAFDTFLANEQSNYCFQDGPLSISLIQLLKNVERESRVLLQFANLIEKLDDNLPSESFQCLDLLYDLVCAKQAVGEENEFRETAGIFFKCFESYAKPIQLWMETGELDPLLGSAFFVTAADGSGDLKTLWHNWFSFQERSGQLYAPKFLHPSSRKIFTTGKSIVFLRRLGVTLDFPQSTASKSLTYEDIFPSDSDSLLLPFSSQLELAFDRFVDANYSATSTLLRSQLDDRYGLWTTLDALEYIYLGKDCARAASIDYRVFELIDRGSQSWNDRFLTTELLQQAFATLTCVDPSRLACRSAAVPEEAFKNYNRSVSLLKALSVDYTFPWPVANIVTREAISSYQRISNFLMQIRRAKYCLESNWLLKSHELEGVDEKSTESILGFCIRQRLAWFLSVLYFHYTEVVISQSTEKMIRTLDLATDVDSMINVHQSYMTNLEAQFLLLKDLLPVHKIIIALLDLCIYFSDIQTTFHLENQVDHDSSNLFSSSAGAHFTRGQARRFVPRDEFDSDNGEEADMHDSIFDNGNASNISFVENPYRKRLLEVKRKFSQLCGALRSSLKEASSNDCPESWEILAGNLSWNENGV